MIIHTFQAVTTWGGGAVNQTNEALGAPHVKIPLFSEQTSEITINTCCFLVSKLLVYGRLTMLLNQTEGGHFTSRC